MRHIRFLLMGLLFTHGISAHDTCEHESAVVFADITASRTECTSPCTVIFSAKNTLDTTKPSFHDVFKKLGYHFTFDDPNSGEHHVTGMSKNDEIGGPIATHTFVCNEPLCLYNVGVRAQNETGDYDDDYVQIKVFSPDVVYSLADTYCVSKSEVWTGCPSYAHKINKLPVLGSYSGKRILLSRGEVFDGNVCIDYRESNVHIGAYGDPAKPVPELLNTVNVGVNGRCSNATLTTNEVQNIDNIGPHNVTISNLRAPEIVMGMTYDQVGFHNIDMNYKDKSYGGHIELASNTNMCTKQSKLDCAVIPYPTGLYFDNVTVIQSDAVATSSGGGVLISGYNCPMINWLGMIGSEFWNSNQHQLRLEGAQNFNFSHNNILGNTRGTKKQHPMTIRSCGPSNIDINQMVLDGSGRHKALQATEGAPWTRWGVIANNVIGSPTAENPTFKLHIAPTKYSSLESVVDVVINGNLFVESPDHTSIDLNLNGLHLTAWDNTETRGGRQFCKIGSQGANPNYGNMECDAIIPPIPEAPGTR